MIKRFRTRAPARALLPAPILRFRSSINLSRMFAVSFPAGIQNPVSPDPVVALAVAFFNKTQA